eukprot:SAG11_NODE_33376_length_277_cov_1.859551_1_plen_26_part_10
MDREFTAGCTQNIVFKTTNVFEQVPV